MTYLYLIEAFFWAVVSLYLGYFYLKVFKHDKSKLVLRRFNNAIKLAYRRNTPSTPLEDVLKQLIIDYNNIIRHIGKIEYSSCLDVLEQMFYRYDTYSDKEFHDFFKENRNEDIRDFIYSLCKQMKDRGEYIDLPRKEEMIISNIKSALENNNVALGTACIDQLVKEIVSKDYELKQQQNDNEFGKTLSVLGIIISLAFGILSIIMYFNPIAP